MKRPDEKLLHSFRTIARQYPEFVEYLSEWRLEELEQLPYAKDNLGVLQGRAQTLKELQRALQGTVE